VSQLRVPQLRLAVMVERLQAGRCFGESGAASSRWKTNCVFVADTLAAWLIGLLADTGRKRLTTFVLGSEQERALRSAATKAVQLTADELRPGDYKRADQLAMVISQVFGDPAPGAPLAGHVTVLEALQAGIAGQIAVLDDASLTGTGQSSADLLGVPATVVAAGLLTSGCTCPYSKVGS
jgi:hypothetical protein